MPNTLNKKAHQQLFDEDVTWLLRQPRSLERDHIKDCLLWMREHQHGREWGFPQVVCLCGSTRFMDAFHATGWQLTLDGYIVLTVGVCKHAEDHGGEVLGSDVAAKLDELHLRKIDMADIVMILNVDGYIGESTQKELDYAKQHGKTIVFLEKAPAHAPTGAAAESPPADTP